MYKIILLFLPFFCFAEEFYGREQFQLKTILQRGKPGQFMVAAHQKNYTIWHIKDRRDGQLLMEEITVPSKRLHLANNSWQGWVDADAPQHIAWVSYTIDLHSGLVTGLYSYDQGCWLSEDIPNRFLATLLNVPFYPVADIDRRRTGKGPMHSNPYWNPPLFYQSQEIVGQTFTQYITRWPMDGSELANKKVEIYLLQSDQFPSFLPYWLQVSGGFGKVSVRIVDSGSNLTTPTQPMWKLSTANS